MSFITQHELFFLEILYSLTGLTIFIVDQRNEQLLYDFYKYLRLHLKVTTCYLSKSYKKHMAVLIFLQQSQSTLITLVM